MGGPAGAPGEPRPASPGSLPRRESDRPQFVATRERGPEGKGVLKAFRRFWPPGAGALGGPRGHQKTAQDEELVLGKAPGVQDLFPYRTCFPHAELGVLWPLLDEEKTP